MSLATAFPLPSRAFKRINKLLPAPWPLFNAACFLWLVFQTLLWAVLTQELHQSWAWIPNRAAVIIDVLQGFLTAFALVVCTAVGVYSFLHHNARRTAVANLSLVATISVFFVVGFANLFFWPVPKAALPEVAEQVESRPAPPGNVEIVAGGDVSFDRRFEHPTVLRHGSALGNLPITLS